jgi:single-stranded-DNA-specific exonuclease
MGSTGRLLKTREAVTDPAALPADLHPVLRRVYAARGIGGAADLRHTLDALLHPRHLGGLDVAAGLLADAVMDGRHILIVGDFDADGATSCAVSVRALRAMGAARVGYLVPNRFDFGYGLSPEIVEVAARQRPDLLVTVDNGISSLDGVAAARAAGMRVVVTDHHLPGAVLPAADAIVNPNLAGDGFPSKALAGVGVIFYVMMALRGELRRRGWFAGPGRAEPRLAELLDLVAVGTIADVVPLDRNNRILVEQGLRRIRAGQMVPGLQALLEVSGREHGHCVAADIGFAVGPRLNAAGRLEDMSLGIECLLTDDPGTARRLALQLEDLNRQRREIESRMREEAMAALERRLGDLEGDAVPNGLCVTDDAWHQGVIGILASRIRERFHRPTIAFAPAGDGMLKGSGRSIPGLHLRDLLERIASRNPGLIPKFGGHAMAAGLSLAADGFHRFRNEFDAAVAATVSPEDLQGVLLTDGELAAAEMDLDLARLLRAAGPWGQAFPEPLFEGRFHVRGRRVVGDNHLKMRLEPIAGGGCVDAIAFGALDHGWDRAGDIIQVAYRLDVNRYQGSERLQLRIEHVQVDEAAAAATI